MSELAGLEDGAGSLKAGQVGRGSLVLNFAYRSRLLSFLPSP